MDKDFAVVYDTDQSPDLKSLQANILGLTGDVPDVTQNNGSDFEWLVKIRRSIPLFSLFRYGFDDLEAGFTLRQGISTVEIVFVAQNPKFV